MGLTNECLYWVQTQQNQGSKKKHPAGLQVDIFKTWGVQSPFLIKFEGRSSSKANIGKQSKHLKSIELSRARGLNLPNNCKKLVKEIKLLNNRVNRLDANYKGLHSEMKTSVENMKTVCFPHFQTNQVHSTETWTDLQKEVIFPVIKSALAESPIFQELKQDITGMRQDITGIKQDITGIKQDITGIKQDITGMKQSLVLHGNVLQKLWVDPSEKEELKKSNQKLNDFKGANIHLKSQDHEDGDKH